VARSAPYPPVRRCTSRRPNVGSRAVQRPAGDPRPHDREAHTLDGRARGPPLRRPGDGRSPDSLAARPPARGDADHGADRELPRPAPRHHHLHLPLRLDAPPLRLLAVPRRSEPRAVQAVAQHGARGRLDGGAGSDPRHHRRAVVQAPLLPGRAAEDRAHGQSDRQAMALDLRIPGQRELHLRCPGARRFRAPARAVSPSRHRQSGGVTDQDLRQTPGDGFRCHPRLDGARLRRENRRGAGPPQRGLALHQRAWHVLRAMLGTLRPAPRFHADRRQGGAERGVRGVGRRGPEKVREGRRDGHAGGRTGPAESSRRMIVALRFAS